MLENLEKAILEIKESFPALALAEYADMSRRCSFKAGGTVRALACPEDAGSLMKLCSVLKKYGQAPLMLGNCTNLIFPDEGLEDVFAISTEGLTKMFLLPDGAIYAEAGVSLSKLASFAYQNGLAGLEFASGIPASVGGALLMNAGAYGGEMKDCAESVVCYHLPEEKLWELKNDECEFRYRGSVFKDLGNCVILSGVFRLEKGDAAEIAEKMRDFNGRRRDKQPLDLPSAGSAFKRPEGYFAAALIEQAGLKGYSIGGAQVSQKHAGFVVNAGGATAKDVAELLEYVKKTVFDKFQVELEPEIILLPAGMKLEL